MTMPVRRFLLAACLALPFAGVARAVPMTHDQARAWLQDQQIEVSPDNLVQQIMTGNADAVDALVGAGLDVNAKSSLPQSPLELAGMTCAGGRVSPPVTIHIMDTLIAAGADPNAPGMQGLGPLMIAAQQCDGSVVKRLIAAGARLDSRTVQGYTPLTMALIVKNYPAAEALVDAGARITPEAAHKLTDGSTDDRLKGLVTRATAG
jgi:uncharacterized protein